MTRAPGPLRILHVLVQAGPTNGQYNEHCLPFAGSRSIDICSLRPASVTPPPEITLFEGDGTPGGVLRVLEQALGHAEHDVVHAHAPASGAALLAANLLRRRSMARCVFTLQNSFQNYPLRNRLLLYPIFAGFPAVVLCSESVRASLPPSLRKLGGPKIAVAANGVDLDRVDRVLAGVPRRPDGQPFTVVSVGRLVDIKNPATLLHAFDRARGPADRLVLVGDGPLRPQLEGQADGVGLAGQATFTGLVGRDDVFRNVVAGDLYASVSYGEGMPVAVLEAMACARPVVLSDIEPHREIARGVDFIPLVHPDDVDGFAAHIRRFRAMTPGRRAEIGALCRRVVEDRFSLAAMHAVVGDVYARVAGRPATELGGVR
jgi:glycosyltransferase involved in cell wall biosynthesis